MVSPKKLLLLCGFISFIGSCKHEQPQPYVIPDLNAVAGNYLVSGTHFNWYYYFGPGIQPYDSIINNTYGNTNDTITITKVNDTTVFASLSDSGITVTSQMNFVAQPSSASTYIFTSGNDGSPNFDSLVVYIGNPNSLYLFFTANVPHSGGDTYQMRGSKMH